jgi:phosphoglycolate phosphatase-like HAD superfamily hydrolase
MRLVLFDIDGTLILTRGAGMRAFYRAMRHVFDITVDSEVICPDGKTDPLIAKELLAHFGQADRWSEESRNALFSSYLSCLEEEMSRARESGSIRILPGVTWLLDGLISQPDFALGLVTGNLEEGARIKLEKAGLDRYFRFGGYGSDSEDRTALIRVGIRRGAQLVAPAPVESSFVIGDTPLDIIHGHSAGACVIAVASAKYSVDDLRPHSPDLLVPDLTQVDSIISFMRMWPERLWLS